MMQRTATEVEQFQHLIEGRRVARSGSADREQPGQVTGDQTAGQHRFPSPHPVAVTHHRVDFTVVSNHSVGMRQRPRREGVRGEPRVHQADSGGESRVHQIREELLQLSGGEHALVPDGPNRQ